MALRQKDLKLSSNRYVPMRLAERAGGTAEGRPTPTPIRSIKTCEHETTICADCADSWAMDWDIYWGRTLGGRRLRNKLIAKGNLAIRGLFR